jgi:C4-dicarboxylate-specific signal transduction histidine kinase
MDNDEVILEVKDNGPGIPEDIVNSLGTPFLTTKENSTGLGLGSKFKNSGTLSCNKNRIFIDGNRFSIRFPSFNNSTNGFLLKPKDTVKANNQ